MILVHFCSDAQLKVNATSRVLHLIILHVVIRLWLVIAQHIEGGT